MECATEYRRGQTLAEPGSRQSGKSTKGRSTCAIPVDTWAGRDWISVPLFAITHEHIGAQRRTQSTWSTLEHRAAVRKASV